MHQAIDLQDFVNELSFGPLIRIALCVCVWGGGGGGGGGGQYEKKMIQSM